MIHDGNPPVILSLPLSLPDATPIGDRYAMQTRDGFTYYFFNLEPFDCHPVDDRRAMLLRAAKLHVVSGVPQADIMGAFNLSRPTVARAVKRYRERGEDAFFEPRRGRGRTVVDAEMADKAAALLACGMSGSACARHLGIPVSTFNENRRAGVIAALAPAPALAADAPQTAVATDHLVGADAAQTDPAAATDRATRDARDKHAPLGRAARDVERRTLASAGLMTEATPVFAEPAHAVARGGVLAALPLLLREGLLGAANRLFRLPAGFYGLSTILLFVACMTLARVRNPEALRYQAPGEWGAILGLDRCPEAKTLRRKLRLLASAEHTVARLASGTGSHLGHRARGRLGHAGRGRPRESVRWAQRSAAETLRRAPEAVFASVRELLDQRPRRSAAAVPAPGAGPEAGQGARARRGAPLGGTGRGAASGPRPDQAAGPSASAYPGVRPRGLEPGPVQASGPARHRLHHLAQELQGRRLAGAGVLRP